MVINNDGKLASTAEQISGELEKMILEKYTTEQLRVAYVNSLNSPVTYVDHKLWIAFKFEDGSTLAFSLTGNDQEKEI